jgi:hypothetical protein
LHGSTVEEIALDGQCGGSSFPLQLRGQALAGPAREGVGFEVAYVAHRPVGIHRQQAMQCHVPPAAVDLLPVERGPPVRLSHSTPAVRQPKACFVISTGIDELQVLAVGHWLWRQRKGFQKGAMVRCLVVETKALASGSNGNHAGGKFEPLRRRGCLDFRRVRERQVRRPHGVERQKIFDIGEQQLLMLLLVM